MWLRHRPHWLLRKVLVSADSAMHQSVELEERPWHPILAPARLAVCRKICTKTLNLQNLSPRLNSQMGFRLRAQISLWSKISQLKVTSLFGITLKSFIWSARLHSVTVTGQAVYKVHFQIFIFYLSPPVCLLTEIWPSESIWTLSFLSICELAFRCISGLSFLCIFILKFGTLWHFFWMPSNAKSHCALLLNESIGWDNLTFYLFILFSLHLLGVYDRF